MSRLPGIALLLLPALLTLSAAARLQAQIYLPPPVFYPPFGYPGPHPTSPDPPDPKDAPVEIGGYATVGGATDESASDPTGSFVGSVGLYGQWNRFGLCPGLDLRIQGNTEHLHGYLVGPRVAFQPRGHLRPFRLYGEALFGKNETTQYNNSSAGLFTSSSQFTGVSSFAVIGVDLHYNSAFGWRVIEFSKGEFTGISGSRPQTITTGILIHFP